MKKIVLFLFITLLLLPLLNCSAAAPDLSDINDCGIAVIYIPATRNETEVTTARYAAEALKARPNPQNRFWIASIGQKKTDNDSVDKGVQSGNATGRETLQDDVVKELKKRDYHLWFIVPQKAADAFCGNNELVQQMRDLTKDRIMRIHILFIGDGTAEPAQDSPLARFASETGKADWMLTATDFLSTTRRTQGNRQIHTGSYYIASLFGTPADLQTEGTSEISFTAPETGSVLLLARGEKLNEYLKMDGVSSQTTMKTFEVKLTKKTVFRGLWIEQLPEGSYTVQKPAAAESVSVYYYPRMENIRPSMTVDNVEEGFIERGETVLRISMENDLGRPEAFQAEFVCKTEKEGTEPGTETLTAEYDEESGTWQAKLTIQPEDTAVGIAPVIRLDAADGNALWDWQGEEKRLEIKTQKVSVQERAPAAVTIYYDAESKKSGKVSFEWTDFFKYNSADNPELEISNREEAESRGYAIKSTAGGFTIQIGESMNPQSVRLALRCAETAHEVTLGAGKIEDLNKTIRIDADDSQAKAGGSAYIRAEIPAETAEKFEEAGKQNSSFTGPIRMILRVSKNQTDPGKTASFEQKGDKWQAEVKIDIPAEQQKGTLTYSAKVTEKSNANRILISSDSLSVEVANENPALQDGLNLNARQTVSKGGLPAEWEEIAVLKTVIGPGEEVSLLEQAFRTTKPFTLFTDKETAVKSVTVSIEPADGLILPEGTEGGTEDGTWTYVLEKADQELEIKARPRMKPVQYTIRIKASDGPNESEETEAVVTVASETVRIATYIAIGILAALLLLIVFLIIRQVRKPRFDNINVRCLVTTDEDVELSKEMMSKSKPVAMLNFKKKPVQLSTVLAMTHQPPMAQENAEVSENILLLPSRHDELIILFEKKALEQVGRHDRKETVSLGNTYRLRLGNTYILIENVR